VRILVTGANGFVGRNLCEALRAIRDGKDARKGFERLLPMTIYEYDLDSSPEDLELYCADAEFVFNLAGVNRPQDPKGFMEGNFGFASDLLKALEVRKNACPIMLASSAQASLEGRYVGSEYGRSKLAGERLFRDYGRRTGAQVLIYRFPNLYGKWCQPNYNSAVATFCDNIANGLPVRVDDPDIELELLYIDDLVSEMLRALLGREDRVVTSDGEFCVARPTDKAKLGDIVQLIHGFRAAQANQNIPYLKSDSFSKKLCSTYLSYSDPRDLVHKLRMNADSRGSFTEILHTPDRGQVSVNVSKPGITKGKHWHNTKWEKFCVVSGQGLVRLRKMGSDSSGRPFPVVEHKVSAGEMTVVDLIPGYVHEIINLSDREDLVTVIWCNEMFDPDNPDTYGAEV